MFVLGISMNSGFIGGFVFPTITMGIIAGMYWSRFRPGLSQIFRDMAISLVLLLSYSMWSGALGNLDLLLSCSIISISLHNT